MGVGTIMGRALLFSHPVITMVVKKYLKKNYYREPEVDIMIWKDIKKK